MLNTLVRDFLLLVSPLLLAFVCGGGWAFIFGRRSKLSTFSFVARLFLLIPVISGLAAVIVVFLDLGGLLGIQVFFGIGAIGWIFAIYSSRKPISAEFPRPAKIPGWQWVTFALLAFVSLSPQVDSNGQLNIGMRTGPDAIGYGASAIAVADNLSSKEILLNVNDQLLQRGFTPNSSGVSADVYKIPGYTDQVQAEFLVGAKRWGMALYTGTLVTILGEPSVWALQSVTAMYSIFGLMLMSLGISSRGKTRTTGADLLVPAFVALNANLLFVWHEGGLAQIWVLPVIFAIAYLVTERAQSANFKTGLLAAGLMSSLVFTYFDAFLLLSIVLFGYWLALVTSRKITNEIRRTLGGLVVGLSVTVFLLFTEIAQQTFARLGDSQIAGWSTPRWLSPADSLGLFDAYKGINVLPRRGINLPNDLPDSMLTEIVILLASIFVVALFVIGLSISKLVELRLLTFSSFAVLLVLYMKTRYLDDGINYQYLKGITMLLPIIFLAAASMQPELIKRLQKSSQIPVQGIAYVSITLLTLASISFQENWRSSVAWTAPNTSIAISSKEIEEILDEYTVLNTPGYLDSQMVVVANLKFAEMGRTTLSDEKVVTVIDQNVCSSMECAGDVKKEWLLYSSNTLKILALPLMAKDITADPVTNCSKIATAWNSIGAKSLGTCGAW